MSKRVGKKLTNSGLRCEITLQREKTCYVLIPVLWHVDLALLVPFEDDILEFKLRRDPWEFKTEREARGHISVLRDMVKNTMPSCRVRVRRIEDKKPEGRSYSTMREAALASPGVRII